MTEEYKLSRRDFLKLVGEAVALTGLAGLVAACASMRPKPDFYPQKGMPNTMTYIDSKTKEEKVVYDLSGNWEAVEYHSGSRFKIVQEGNQLKIITIDGTKYKPAGYELIKGSIDGNLVKGEYDVYPDGWRPLEGKINRTGDYIETRTYWSQGVGILNLKKIKK